jgi:anti-sigma B factor antagonist
MENAANMAPVLVEGNGLKIAVSNTGPTKEISIVRIDGAVDTMTAGDLEHVISSLIARGRYRLVLDLAGVEYISSAGWGVFVSHLREIRERAGDIKLARMTPDVREIYELLEFDGLLPFFNDLDSAVAEFQGIDNRGSARVPEPLVAERQTSGIAHAGAPLPTEHTPSVTTLDEAVLQQVAEDPFQTIREIRQRLQERHGDSLQSGWWKVFGCLYRQHLLGRRARFRYCRRLRKTYD